VVDLLKLTGQVDFDPKNKGVFDATKKNWVENYYLDPKQMNKVKQQLEQYDTGTRKKVKLHQHLPLITLLHHCFFDCFI